MWGYIVAVLLLGSFAVSWALGAVILRRATSFSPRVIVDTIRQPGCTHKLRVSTAGKVWDPSKPVGYSNGILGPGYATYWLDDLGQVNLHFQPPSGSPLHVAGPVPQNLPEPLYRSRRYKRLSHRTNVALALF
jgi:hypothetical protein